MSINNDAASMYSSTGGFWPPVNRVFRKLGYEIVPTKARLPREVRPDYDCVMTIIDPYTFKFLDVRTCLTATLLNAYRLGLHNSAPLSILDLGTGVGYFPVVCAHYGHRVIAIDRDGNRIFEEFPKWLGVDRRSHEIRAGEPLPVMETRFDLVTAFMVNFDQYIDRDLSQWGVDEWRYFLRDVAQNQLLPNGRLVLHLNPRTTQRADILSYFRAEGAEITKGWVEFNRFARHSERTLAGVP